MNSDRDDIDKFFEKRLQSGDFPFMEEDWDALRRRLDQDDELIAMKPPSRFRSVTWGIAVIVAFLIGWFLGDRFDMGNQINADTQNELNAGSESFNNPGEIVTNDQDSSEPWPNNEILLSDDPIATPDESQNSGITFNVTAKSDEEATVDLYQYSDSVRQRKDLLPFLKTDFPEYIEGITESVIPVRMTKPPVNPSVFSWEKLPEPTDDFKPPVFSLGLTLSPDLNSTGISEPWKAAPQIGLFAGIPLNDKWSIQTGFLYAKREYVAQGEDYTPPEGYWDYFTGGQIPELVDAACGMIDIPLNINYNIFSSLNSRIFIGSGISTFIVLNEKYEYEFSNYADYPDGWETDETSVLWGGFWNITAGMETKILNGWDVRIEPYFRVPVRSVGYGNINLYGSGILFTLKRNFYRPD